MQDQDPHHMHSSGWELYIFLLSGIAVVIIVFYFTVKLMKRLDKRKAQRAEERRLLQNKAEFPMNQTKPETR